MKYESKVFVSDNVSKLSAEDNMQLNSNIKAQKDLINDEEVSAKTYSNLDAIKQGLEKGGVNLDKANPNMGNSAEQIAKTFLNAIKFTLNYDLPKQTNTNIKDLFLAGDYEATQLVVKNMEKLLNKSIPVEAIEHGVNHYKGHVNYHNHVRNKEFMIKMKDGNEAQIQFIKENLDDHIGVINRLKEIRSEAKVFFKNFGKNKLGEVTGAKIKENLKDLMKLPGYTLTYGIGGESGLMKTEVLKEKAKNSIQSLWEKTLEYVHDVQSIDLIKTIENNIKNFKNNFSVNKTELSDEKYLNTKLKI